MSEDFKSSGKTAAEVEESDRPVFRKGDERDFLESFYQAPPGTAATEPEGEDLEGSVTERIIRKIRSIYDPEIPVNIYDLGLIYRVDVDDQGFARIDMTLTTPHCPVAESMPGEVAMRIGEVSGVNDVKIELVWDPPWDPSMMTEVARLELGLL